jgi:hypothetical protein
MKSYFRVSLILGMVFAALMSRFLPHPPNFTALNALALFGASVIGNVWAVFGVLFASLLFSDLLLGFHSTLAFVYLSFALTIVLGRIFNCKNSWRSRFLCATAAALLFFLVANLGVWMTTDYYPKTAYGLLSCYLAALPFLLNQWVGDLFYVALLFGCYSLASLRICFIRSSLSR